MLLAISEPTFPSWFSILPDRSLYTAGDVSIPCPAPRGLSKAHRRQFREARGDVCGSLLAPGVSTAFSGFCVFLEEKKLKKRKKASLLTGAGFPKLSRL